MDRQQRKRKKMRAVKIRRISGAVLFAAVLLCGAAFASTMIFEHTKGAEYRAPTVSDKGGYTVSERVETSGTSPGDTDKSDWRLLLVSAQSKLPSDFAVKLTKLKNGHSIDERAYPDLQEMMDAARTAGLSPLICSSYRTQKKQQTLFDKKINSYLAKGYSQKEAELKASELVAVPGTSEHQSGLAVDIVATSYQILDEKQAETAEQVWLMENSYKYGFVLRYPYGKSDITAISYEPWHYRYVGKAAAKEIYEQNICLEEYLDK